jgi:hypothetical protein
MKLLHGGQRNLSPLKGRRGREQPGFQRRFIELRWQRPAYPGSLSPGKIFGDGTSTDGKALGDLSERETFFAA